MKNLLALLIVFLLAACSSPTTGTPVPASTSPGPIPTLPPLNLTPTAPATSTLITISQNGSFTSQPFTVNTKAFLRVNWRQSCATQFTLVIQNTDPRQAGTPYGEITFDHTAQPGAMVVDYLFIPGDYVIKVISDGPFTVWVETITSGPLPVP